MDELTPEFLKAWTRHHLREIRREEVQEWKKEVDREHQIFYEFMSTLEKAPSLHYTPSDTSLEQDGRASVHAQARVIDKKDVEQYWEQRAADVTLIASGFVMNGHHYPCVGPSQV